MCYNSFMLRIFALIISQSQIITILKKKLNLLLNIEQLNTTIFTLTQ